MNQKRPTVYVQSDTEAKKAKKAEEDDAAEEKAASRTELAADAVLKRRKAREDYQREIKKANDALFKAPKTPKKEAPKRQPETLVATPQKVSYSFDHDVTVSAFS
jgi:hypothetical protein